MTWDSSDFRAALGATLEEYLDAQAARLAPLGQDAAHLVEAARSAVRGGKRFRGAFCFWGYQSVARIEDESTLVALVRACAALELLHASALVHDDLMDASDTRRGRPATHRAFEAWHREQGWTGRAEQYGEAAALLVGDLLLSWADELLRRCGLPEPRVAEAMTWFDTTRSEVIAGQFLDVSVQARSRSDVDTAMLVLRYKSAKYSVERPLHVGAALAGASVEELTALSEVGLPLGEAFQLRDDLLGVFGDPAVTGKPAGDDLVEGKRTVLVALALAASPAAAAQRLDVGLGTDLDETEVAELRTIIEASGAQADVEDRIAGLTTRSLEALERAPLREPARQVLRELAAAATQRTV